MLDMNAKDKPTELGLFYRERLLILHPLPLAYHWSLHFSVKLLHRLLTAVFFVLVRAYLTIGRPFSGPGRPTATWTTPIHFMPPSFQDYAPLLHN